MGRLRPPQPGGCRSNPGRSPHDRPPSRESYLGQRDVRRGRRHLRDERAQQPFFPSARDVPRVAADDAEHRYDALFHFDAGEATVCDATKAVTTANADAANVSRSWVPSKLRGRPNN